MKAKDKKVALGILKDLFEDGQIEVAKFGPRPQLLIKGKRNSRQGQPYLNLESSWMLTDTLPDPLPNSEDDFPNFEMDEQLRILRSISEQTISSVELGNKHPHLILTLEKGKIFLINGIHYGYECWQAGISPNPKESCLIVACPGGNLAIWPDRARK